jgi:hypothetical protein
MVDLTYQMVLSTLQTAGLLVGIFYYIMALRNQQKSQDITIETRQAQLFMQMQDRFNDEVKGFDIINKLQTANVNTAEKFIKLWESDETFFKAIRAITSFSEGFGVLVKEGLMNIRYVALM